MTSKARLSMIIALIAAMGAIGIIETVWATPDGSQRLRGMAGRVFYVEVEVVSTLIPGDTGPVGTVFDNCYFFNDGGEWVDPGFVPGIWEQHGNGAATTYEAYAAIAAFGFELLQEGSVTPAKGKGVLQLEAFSTFLIEGTVFAEFESIGSEVEDCPL